MDSSATIDKLIYSSNLNNRNIQRLDANFKSLRQYEEQMRSWMEVEWNNTELVYHHLVLTETRQQLSYFLSQVKLEENFLASELQLLSIRIQQIIDHYHANINILMKQISKSSGLMMNDEGMLIHVKNNTLIFSDKPGVIFAESRGQIVSMKEIIHFRCLFSTVDKKIFRGNDLIFIKENSILHSPVINIPVERGFTGESNSYDCSQYMTFMDNQPPQLSTGVYYMNHGTQIYLQAVPHTKVVITKQGKSIVVGLNPVLLGENDFPLQINKEKILFSQIISFKKNQMNEFILFNMSAEYFKFTSDPKNLEDFTWKNVISNFQDLFANSKTFRVYSLFAIISTSIVAIGFLLLILTVCRRFQLINKLRGFYSTYKTVIQKEDERPPTAPERPPKVFNNTRQQSRNRKE